MGNSVVAIYALARGGYLLGLAGVRFYGGWLRSHPVVVLATLMTPLPEFRFGPLSAVDTVERVYDEQEATG